MYRARKVYFKAIYRLKLSEIEVIGHIEYPDYLGLKIPIELKNMMKKIGEAELIDFKYLQFTSGIVNKPKIVELRIYARRFVNYWDYLAVKRKIVDVIRKYVNELSRKVIS